MQISLMLIGQIMSMAIMVVMGFVLAKKGLLTGEESRPITKALIYIIVPCSLINAFGTEFDVGKLEGMAVALALSVVIYMIFMGIGRRLEKGKAGLTGGEVCSIIYSNSGNLIVPIVTGVLGVEYVIYTCAFMLVQNLLTWTHGQMKLGGESDLTVKKVLSNPCILSILAGLFLFVTRIPLPGVVDNAIGSMGACIGPLYMLVTGVLLAEADLKQTVSSRRTYAVVGLRLIVYPLLVIALLWCVSRVWDHEQRKNILMVLLLCSSGPTASTMAQLAQMYGSPESRYISALTAFGTVLSAVTMPLMCILYQAIV